MKLSPFPPGWYLGFLLEVPEGDQLDADDRFEVGFLPIVGMEAREQGRGVAAVVALPSGELRRDHEMDHDVVCIAGPDDDHTRTARAGLAEYLSRRQAPPVGVPRADSDSLPS